MILMLNRSSTINRVERAASAPALVDVLSVNLSLKTNLKQTDRPVGGPMKDWDFLGFCWIVFSVLTYNSSRVVVE